VIAANHVCYLGLTFTPNQPAGTVETASLSINDDATGTPQSVALTGTSSLQVTVLASHNAAGLDLPFGDIAVGGSLTKSVEIENHQSTSISLNPGVSGASYVLATGASLPCGAALAAFSACKFYVTFTPATLGAAGGVLTLNDSPDSDSPYSIALSGIGTTPTTVSPASANFGAVAFGTTSAPRHFILTNHTSAAISVTDSLSGAAFGFGSDGCNGTSLAAYKTCEIFVSYTPSALGHSDSGSLNITDGVDAGYSLPLSGSGVATVTVTPASLSFGNVEEGSQSAPKFVTIENHKSTPIEVGAQITASTGNYEVSGGTCGTPPFALAASKSCTIGVIFKPTTTIPPPPPGTLTVTDITDGGTEYTVSLKGSAPT